jgi:hypothetical protein
MRLWAKTDGPVKEGKYLVVRRDGTIPPWPHFVLGGYDPAAAAALRTYAEMGARLGYDPEFTKSLIELADDFEKMAHRNAGVSDPDAGPHRTDNPAVVAMMRGEGDLSEYAGPETATS